MKREPCALLARRMVESQDLFVYFSRERTRMPGRQITVGITKKNPQDGSESYINDISFENKATIVSEVVDRGISRIVFGVLAYVALDTVRQMVLNSQKKHTT
jgi:hypothetical protein